MSDVVRVTEQPCRALWIQVVTQAKEDLEEEPIASILYDHAVAFFVGGGHWAESRGVIADLLAMHPDDLFRSGQRWIAARRTRDGLPPEPPQDLRAASTSLPRLVALPGADTRVIPKPHRGGSLRAAEAHAFITEFEKSQLNSDKQLLAPRRRKRCLRHWSTVPGATNPFGPRPAGTD